MVDEHRVGFFGRLGRFLGRIVASVNPDSTDIADSDGRPTDISRRRSLMDGYKRGSASPESHSELIARTRRNRFGNVLDTYHILETGHARPKPGQNRTDTPESSSDEDGDETVR